MTPLAANFLVPNGGFFVSLAIAVLVLGVAWVWPMVAVARRQQWGWFLAIFFFGPIAALIWLLLGRRQDAIGST